MQFQDASTVFRVAILAVLAGACGVKAGVAFPDLDGISDTNLAIWSSTARSVGLGLTSIFEAVSAAAGEGVAFDIQVAGIPDIGRDVSMAYRQTAQTVAIELGSVEQIFFWDSIGGRPDSPIVDGRSAYIVRILYAPGNIKVYVDRGLGLDGSFDFARLLPSVPPAHRFA
jgi:hypothetical protein